MKQISDEPPKASSIVSGLPAQVDGAIAWMMAKDPAQRPPNLMSALKSLESAAQAAGIRIPTSPPPETTE